jgi:branched-chain amino acid transport system permease protein
MGISSGHARLLAFAFGSGIAGLAGGLWAGFLGSSGEPGNYDFQISIITLCLLIVGGMGSILGVLIGALIMIGFNSIILVKISQFMNSAGLVSTTNVFTQPNNWKYMIFGMALILMMRYRPQGVCPEQVREDKSVPPATKAVRPL